MRVDGCGHGGWRGLVELLLQRQPRRAGHQVTNGLTAPAEQGLNGAGLNQWLKGLVAMGNRPADGAREEPLREVLTLSRRGQIALPAGMRRHLGIAPGGAVIVEECEGELRLKPDAV